MGSVVIAGVTYTVYGDWTGAGSLTEYANASLVYSATFAAATSDNQKRAMVEATRIMDQMPWAGTKTVAGQALAWPRTGVTLADGTAVDPNTIPTPIINAAYELALAGLVDSAVFSTTTTEDKIKRVEAKGVEVEWFGPRAGGRLPGRAAELVAPYLAGATGSSGVGSGSYVGGTSTESKFDTCDEFGVSGGG